MSKRAWLANGIEGRHVLISLSAFFGVMLLANGIFLYYALETFAGGDTSDPYRKGMHYNDTIAAAARQADQGWKTELLYNAQTRRLALSLLDREGQPLTGLRVNATVSRPATDREDLAVKFSEAQAGMYAAEVHLAPGQWVVMLQSEDPSRAGDPAYRLKQRIFVAEAP
jgi:nitrogen fixation protein FixH